jgi:hypothetical protein
MRQNTRNLMVLVVIPENHRSIAGDELLRASDGDQRRHTKIEADGEQGEACEVRTLTRIVMEGSD